VKSIQILPVPTSHSHANCFTFYSFFVAVELLV
jgi:hypothetical protein